MYTTVLCTWEDLMNIWCGILLKGYDSSNRKCRGALIDIKEVNSPRKNNERSVLPTNKGTMTPPAQFPFQNVPLLPCSMATLNQYQADGNLTTEAYSYELESRFYSTIKAETISFSSIKLAERSQNLIKLSLLLNYVFCFLLSSKILHYLLVFSLKQRRKRRRVVEGR